MSEHRVLRRIRTFIAEEISPVELRYYIKRSKNHEERIAALEKQVKDLIDINNFLVRKNTGEGE